MKRKSIPKPPKPPTGKKVNAASAERYKAKVDLYDKRIKDLETKAKADNRAKDVVAASKKKAQSALDGLKKTMGRL